MTSNKWEMYDMEVASIAVIYDKLDQCEQYNGFRKFD